MRNKIIKILKEFHLDNRIYIGSGAKDAFSEIHCRIAIDRNLLKLKKIDFAIQYDPDSQKIAIWDIKERVLSDASLDLYYDGKTTWNKIRGVETNYIKIQKTGTYAIVACVPVDQFREFLIVNHYFQFGIQTDEKFDEDEKESFEIVDLGPEGKAIRYYGKRYERESKYRDAAIKIHGVSCMACGFNFEEQYGEFGKEYIEVHHIKPLHEGEQTPDPDKDLVCLCSNCHRMVHHKKNETLSLDELKHIVNRKW